MKHDHDLYTMRTLLWRIVPRGEAEERALERLHRMVEALHKGGRTQGASKG